MIARGIDQVAIAKRAGGEGFEVIARFGPMFASQIRLQAHRHRKALLEFPHIGSEHDALIVRAFERVRGGLSIDRFLCDPSLSRKLQSECASLGLRAPEAAINLRLLSIRKQSSHEFRNTEQPARARGIVERLGLGVEAAMRYIAVRFGASVDDMLAHPEIGRAFVEFARRISRGGSDVDYRLCALQIRKGRHISGKYEERVAELNERMIGRRWRSIGSPAEAAWKEVPTGAGLVELRAPEQSLYVLRTRRIEESIEQTFSREAVERLLRSDILSEVRVCDTQLRVIGRKDLPAGTPKAWELFLIRRYAPRFNWPVHEEAA
jgi:hypothetical protein